MNQDFPQLLDGKFAPITWSIGFINSPLNTVVPILEKWLTGLGDPITSEEFSEGVSQSIERLLPLRSRQGNRYLIIQTAHPDWISISSNRAQGDGVRSTTDHLADVLSADCAVIDLVPEIAPREREAHPEAPLGGRQFSATTSKYTHDGTFEHRSIYAGEQYPGKWEFDQTGNIMPFEHADNYAARLIKNRLTPEIVRDYCNAFGIHLFDPGFYAGPSVVVSTNDGLDNNPCKLVSLPDAQSRWLR